MTCLREAYLWKIKKLNVNVSEDFPSVSEREESAANHPTVITPDDVQDFVLRDFGCLISLQGKRNVFENLRDFRGVQRVVIWRKKLPRVLNSLCKAYRRKNEKLDVNESRVCPESRRKHQTTPRVSPQMMSKTPGNMAMRDRVPPKFSDEATPDGRSHYAR